MKIIVTGGAGFIGSHLTEALLKQGHQVLVLDNLSNGSLDNIPAGASFEKVSLQSPALVKILLKFRPQAVFHLAAQGDLRISAKKPIFDAKTNLIASLNLLEAMRISGAQKIIFASSAAVYGPDAPIMVKEAGPLAPISPYGIWKLAGENLCQFYQKTYHIKAVILRASNVYGPRQGITGEGGVVARFIKKLVRGQKPIIFGDGSQTRDFVFVDDVVAANLNALKNWELTGTFNIATQKETSVLELHGALRELAVASAACGFEKAATSAPTKAYALKPRFALLPTMDQPRSCLEAELARQELSWHAAISLSEGLKLTWQWFVKNYQ